MSARITPALAAAAGTHGVPDEALEVVLELGPVAETAEGSRADRIARQKAEFQAMAEPVKAVVRQLGGSVEAEAWINGTLKARVPASALRRLKDVEGIVAIDVPHRIERE